MSSCIEGGSKTGPVKCIVGPHSEREKVAQMAPSGAPENRPLLAPSGGPLEPTQWGFLEAWCLSAVKFFFGAILKTKSPKSQKKFSGNFENEKGTPRERLQAVLKKTKEDHMNNLHIIANYLFDNPGARYMDITKHLCQERGKVWSKGHYTRYFTNPIYSSGRRYAHHLWEKTQCGGWMLTLEGYGYVRK